MRYFIELAYDGKGFSGFQIQNNAITIQSTVQSALKVLLKQDIFLTGSSRTDVDVNAYQNFFHFDFESDISNKIIYNLNAILPKQIVIKNLLKVLPNAHCRFSALSRTYEYKISLVKNPFTFQKAYFFPYKLSIEKLNEAAMIIKENNYFKNFCKTNTQVSNFSCQIIQSFWIINENEITYTVEANRFLRGMVKALVGTSLQYGIGNLSNVELIKLFSTALLNTKANFTPPGFALYLCSVKFPKNIFINQMLTDKGF